MSLREELNLGFVVSVDFNQSRMCLRELYAEMAEYVAIAVSWLTKALGMQFLVQYEAWCNGII